ncbi:response regulator transcription factor [Actinocrinis puniceicyclus]|uniref:Response regulator transcription factor n=1 Tax=Actinocrinis puniceicyclus TaxID=977794 RepID=A0A8J7WMU2_9ACTN|nr:response regulator transcription factor [Actinocrinis puniceicyclus]MBS2962340.1 response regulator transcription factor [Actinocrinis puniceicyclus]
MPASVLIVEDERKIRDLLRASLEHEGFSVLSTESGAEAIALARTARPDLVLLDLRLPDIPGEEVAREIRASAPTAIMMLTAKTEIADRIRGLELGADDYVTKPFSPREVVLRVHSILRRTRALDGEEEPASYADRELVIDERQHQITAHGVPVELTATEWRLLTTLAAAPRRVFSRYELINRIRGYEFDGYERTVDSHVRNLRHKIEREPRSPVLIETVIGIGYRLAATRDTAPSPGAPAG